MMHVHYNTGERSKVSTESLGLVWSYDSVTCAIYGKETFYLGQHARNNLRSYLSGKRRWFA